MDDAIFKLAVIFPALIMVGAGALFAWAWHGRRVDSHPVCRWCGFDLTGKEEDSPQCPECWSGVSRAYGVRTSGVVYGHRERRAGWAALAGITFAVTLVFAFGAIIVRAAGSNLYGQYPAAMVIASVTQGDDQERGAAVFELSQRMKRGAIKKGQLDALWDRLLLMQGEKAEPWRAIYGDTILAGRQTALIDEQRWKRYIGELTRVAIDGDTLSSQAAMAELRARALSTCMSKGELDPILDHILTLQGETTIPWWSGWGDLVESARTVSMVDDARWQRYVCQGIQTAVNVRSVMRRGEPLSLTILTNLRVGSSQQVPEARVDMTLDVFSDGAAIVLDPAEKHKLMALSPAAPIRLEIPFPKAEQDKFKDGALSVLVHQKYEFVPLPRFGKAVEAIESRESSGKVEIEPAQP